MIDSPTFSALYPFVIGYAISVIAAHFLVRWTLNPLWQSLGDPREPNWFLPSLNQGLIERFLYTLSWQLGQPAFIGIWVALKVASQWKKWSENPSYNIFLVGTGLSVLYGVLGAKEIFWIEQSSWKSIYIPLVVVAGNLLLISYNRKKVGGLTSRSG